MQIGQVPYQYVPERIVNNTDAITLEPERVDVAVPSLAPFIPEPVVVVDETPRTRSPITQKSTRIPGEYWVDVRLA